ncbi:hypothetical protein [Streptomyces sp. SID5770]|uniref:hypothetical protein n=1 Tax=unclassified Streptomyces TaxID=2593676 RepID=UPI001F388E56|nr:hypothetical protein [Streptomyces sp. SID5770]
MKAAIADMEPYRRIVGPATRQRVRSTLRAALNSAIAQQLIAFNPAAHVEPEAGKRPKALVRTEERVLRRHRARQDEEREKWGIAWVETGRVFTRENGEPLHPADVTRRFIELYEEIGLPPVRLHDLPDGADRVGAISGAAAPSAHAARTQTAPDGTSEAE